MDAPQACGSTAEDAHSVGHEHGAAFAVGTEVAEGVEVLRDEHHLHHLPAADVLHAVVEVTH